MKELKTELYTRNLQGNLSVITLDAVNHLYLKIESDNSADVYFIDRSVDGEEYETIHVILNRIKKDFHLYSDRPHGRIVRYRVRSLTRSGLKISPWILVNASSVNLN